MRGSRPRCDPRTVIVDETAMVDFAFADTVVATDLDEVMPPSGIVVSGEAGHAHCLTPHAYPYLTTHPGSPASVGGAGSESGLTSRMRDAWTRMRHGVEASRAEMTELWSATACLEHAHPRHDGVGAIVHEDDPFSRAKTVGRRVRTFFSFFEWDRADVLRATWIGLLVFVLVATVGAFALQSGGAAASSDVLHPSSVTAR